MDCLRNQKGVGAMKTHSLLRLLTGLLVLFWLINSGRHTLAQSASNNPLSNNILTPRPFDPGTNTTNPSALAVQAQNPYLGSVPSGVAVPGILPLSLTDVVNRGLRANLGLIDTEQDHLQSRAARIRALSQILPQLSVDMSEDFQDASTNVMGTVKLKAPKLIPNFNYQTSALTYKQSVLDVSAYREIQASHAEEHESEASLADARNIVVLATASAYLQVLAGQSRVKAAEAELASAQTLEATLLKRVQREVSPEIDAIRATVSRQSAEQRLTLAQVRLEKDKLGLARIIGLPDGQEFELSTSLDFHVIPLGDIDALFHKATENRQDIKVASARVEYALRRVQEEGAKRLPSISLQASGGESGGSFGRSYGTYAIKGTISVPIFTGRRIEADVASSQAILNRRKAELLDLQQRTRFDVRSAILDLKAAQKSVEVSQMNIRLANEGSRQAKDRFEAEVSNTVEMMQAQQAMTDAEDNEIDSIYAHNLAKLMLIRAMGTAEHDYLAFLGVQR